MSPFDAPLARVLANEKRYKRHVIEPYVLSPKLHFKHQLAYLLKALAEKLEPNLKTPKGQLSL